MKRSLTVVVVGIVGLVLAWAGWRTTGPSAFAITYEKFQAAQGLEKKIAGGWLMDVYESETPVEVLLALTEGGVLLLNDTTRYDGNFNSTAVGSWKPTGPGQMAAVLLCFVKDITGKLLFYEKGDLTMTLSEDGTSMEGIGVISFYLPGQDPLDPEETPLFAVPVPATAQRMLVN